VKKQQTLLLFVLFIGASCLFVAGFFAWLVNPSPFPILLLPLPMLVVGLLFVLLGIGAIAFLEFALPRLKTWRKILLAGVFLLTIGLTFMRAPRAPRIANPALWLIGYFMTLTGLLACAAAIADIIKRKSIAVRAKAT